MPVPEPIDALQLAFAEAMAFFQAKDIVTPEVWSVLDEKAMKRAFSVAGITKANVLGDAWKAIDRALSKGTTFDDFKNEIGPALERTWSGSVANPSWRMETIFRTNVQSAYSAGRYQVTMDPDIVQIRPYRMFDAVMDSRVSAVCEACDGTTLPADDPWWSGHVPPCHHACRSGFVSLSKEQANGIGVTKKKPEIASSEGFGLPPDLEPAKPGASLPAAIAQAIPA